MRGRVSAKKMGIRFTAEASIELCFVSSIIHTALITLSSTGHTAKRGGHAPEYRNHVHQITVSGVSHETEVDLSSQ